MAHTYEEIRDVVFDILLGIFEPGPGYKLEQFGDLTRAVAIYYKKQNASYGHPQANIPDKEDAELIRDVFWDLFRQGHITLGIDSGQCANWPWFRLSHFGKTALTSEAPYRFTDTSTYISMVKNSAPNIDDLTIMYLNEAVQTFYAGCYLSSSVMLGVAAENSFDRLVCIIKNNTEYEPKFKKTIKGRTALNRISEFQKSIASFKTSLPQATSEGIESNLNMIQEVFRTHRNSTGHPTGKEITREQMYIHLQLFTPFAQKLEQLEDFFS